VIRLAGADRLCVPTVSTQARTNHGAKSRIPGRSSAVAEEACNSRAFKMRPKPISKRTRNAFREFLVGWTLGTIELEFDSAGIECSRDFEPQVSGQRRSLVEQYYHSLDFRDPDDVAKLLHAYENILTVASRDAADPSLQSSERDSRQSEIEELLGWLRRDGFVFDGGSLTSIDKLESQDTAGCSVSEVTRREIIDYLNADKVEWSGRLGGVEFLSRLYQLDTMPSNDHRFASALSDIQQHTALNDDWSTDWVFFDERFRLLQGPDESFLRFLCEMLHPVVRPDGNEVARILSTVNRHLAQDGWELAAYGEMSGRPIFSARRLLADTKFSVRQAGQVARSLDATYVTKQITRMEGAIHSDPELAIGTAKEFVETMCKTILLTSGTTLPSSDDLPKLVKATLTHLQLTPNDIPESAAASQTIRVLLSNLATITKGLAELRNRYGSGHGKAARSAGLAPRHARLAVGAASTLGVFLFETFQERQEAKAASETKKTGQ